MALLLALDQGTTSSRAIVFSDSGEIVSVAQREFQQFFPQPGWVEHDAVEIWTSQRDVASEAMTRARLKPSDVAAIGITNQRETVVVWERATGRPIHRAIVWQDRRTAAECDRLRTDGVERLVQAKTGLLLDPYFSGTKIAWILDHVPGARAAAMAGSLAAGTIDCWLLYRLTGGSVHATDASNASRTMLMNIHTGQWDDELLAMLDVPRQVLPSIQSSSEIYGEVARNGTAHTVTFQRNASHTRDAMNLDTIPANLAGIPIAGIAGDQQAALFGQACFQPGMAKNTYGTGCFMLMNTGPRPVASPGKLLSTVAWKRADQLEYALEGSVFVGGAVVSWLRDGLGIIQSSSEIEALTASVPDSGGVVLVPAFTGLGAPYWDPYARGAIIGLTRGTTAAHIARAAIESIAFQTADLAEAMQQVSANTTPPSSAVSKEGRPQPERPSATPSSAPCCIVPVLTELRADGGASVNDALLQFQADLIQHPVVRPKVTETTALGAAYLAGLALGVWKSPDDIAGNWRADRQFEPQMRPSEAASLQDRWRDAVARSRGWDKG